MILLSRQEPVLRHWIFKRHHLLPSSVSIAVVARDLGDFQLLARLDKLLPDPPSRLLLANKTSNSEDSFFVQTQTQCKLDEETNRDKVV
jgi:hypothetical protein